MKNNTIIIIVAMGILAAIAFFGVMKYQQVNTPIQGTTSTPKADDEREGGSPDEHIDKPGESK